MTTAPHRRRSHTHYLAQQVGGEDDRGAAASADWLVEVAGLGRGEAAAAEPTEPAVGVATGAGTGWPWRGDSVAAAAGEVAEGLGDVLITRRRPGMFRRTMQEGSSIEDAEAIQIP